MVLTDPSSGTIRFQSSTLTQNSSVTLSSCRCLFNRTIISDNHRPIVKSDDDIHVYNSTTQNNSMAAFQTTGNFSTLNSRYINSPGESSSFHHHHHITSCDHLLTSHQVLSLPHSHTQIRVISFTIGPLSREVPSARTPSTLPLVPSTTVPPPKEVSSTREVYTTEISREFHRDLTCTGSFFDSNSTFRRGRATSGGAVFLENSPDTKGSMSLRRSTFSDNAAEAGGALSVDIRGSDDVIITRSQFLS